MKNWITSIILVLNGSAFGQMFPEGIPYQAQIYSQSGNMLSNVTVGVRFTVRTGSLTGTIVWQEDHTLLLNDLGHFSTVIGTGISTGLGTASQFSDIQWGADSHFLEMSVDENNTGAFVSVMNQQMMAVPFAYHSKTTSQQFALSGLADVDTSGIQAGDILKWDGTKWVPQPNPDLPTCDTVAYAYQAAVAGYADTAGYAQNCVFPSLVDSADFAFYADSGTFAAAAFSSVYADTANYAFYADTAQFAIGNWSITGNDNITPSDFLGTLDSTDLVLKAYNQERMRIKANGAIGIGTSTPLAGFHVANADGIVFTGTHGSGSIPLQGTGTRMMWYPGKSAFRSGYVSTTNWDNVNVGEYSFAAGYNTRASGMYSVAFGINTVSSGEGSFTAGKGALASGLYTFAAGENTEANGDYSIALGRAGIADAYGAIAIGYHPFVSGDYGLGLGNYVTVTGTNAVAMGYHAQALHDGSFIYSDASNLTGYTSTTAANQFMVKASGGFVFYTNAGLTTGVILAPGAGAWSMLSDRNSKEHIEELDPLAYLSRLDSIDVFTWNYISQDSSIIHIGPMAQDFYSVFELGVDSTVINSGDFDGVNLLLLKGLYMKMQELEGQRIKIEAMTTELERLRNERQRLELLLSDLERRVEVYEMQQSATTESRQH